MFIQDFKKEFCTLIKIILLLLLFRLHDTEVNFVKSKIDFIKIINIFFNLIRIETSKKILFFYLEVILLNFFILLNFIFKFFQPFIVIYNIRKLNLAFLVTVI